MPAPVVWDVIRRFLRARGYQVFMVQNITDVDDKIIRRLSRRGGRLWNWRRIMPGSSWKDLAALGVEKADVHPKVSDHIPEIIQWSPGSEKGYAYTVDGDVYYSVESFPEYGSSPGVP